jgi:hypothetical protein
MRIALLVLVASCWGTSQPAPAPAPTPEPVAASKITFRAPRRTGCMRTLDAALDKLRTELTGTGMTDAIIDELRDAALESCESMRWSSELLACYDAANTATDLGGCQTMMSPEQTEDLTRRMMEIVSRMHASQVPPPAPAP